MNVTITGDIGAGKTTLARALEARGWTLVTAGGVFREEASRRGMTVAELTRLCDADDSVDRALDDRTREVGSRVDHAVFDSRLAFAMLDDTVDVYVECPPEVAALRLYEAGRPDETYGSVVEASSGMSERSASERERFRRLYGVDVCDLGQYDLVVDGTADPERSADLVQEVVEAISRDGRWVNEGDVDFPAWGGNLCRVSPADPDVVDVLRVETALDNGEGYRAYLYHVDLSLLTDDHLRSVLSYVGMEGVAAGDDMLASAVRALGPGRLASEVVDVYGASWEIPETYHQRDDGYNGPWRDGQQDGLEPWGSLTRAELWGWMTSLGAGRHAPRELCGPEDVDLALERAEASSASRRVGRLTRHVPPGAYWEVHADGSAALVLDGTALCAIDVETRECRPCGFTSHVAYPLGQTPYEAMSSLERGAARAMVASRTESVGRRCL